MSERTAKWMVMLGPPLFLLAMVVPPGRLTEGMHSEYGFQLVVLSYYGIWAGSAVCVVGCVANASFLLASLLLLIRLARGRPWPGFSFIACVAMLSIIAMAVSRVWLVNSLISPWVSPSFLFWFGSAATLAAGSWRLRAESKFTGPHGFEVIPVAATGIGEAAPANVSSVPLAGAVLDARG